MAGTDERFSLKDHLFNRTKVKQLASELKKAYPAFKHDAFIKDVMARLLALELVQRLEWIGDTMHKYLPNDYRKAMAIILKSLPPQMDDTKSDNDFGEFIYAPHGYFVATYGTNKKDLKFSLDALHELTRRFSAEGPIRTFINAYPKQTMVTLSKWSKDPNYHVRRLVSEGTRPLLPWAKKITLPYKQAIPLLDVLHSDDRRFVTRSVANHINDIAKLDSKLVITTLKRWRTLGKQDPKELDYMIRHGLRTLIKQGNKEALALLGYTASHIRVEKFVIKTPKVKIGSALAFSFDIVSTGKKDQKIMIDYRLHFNKANGTLAPKTFKISQKTIRPGQTITLQKKHPLKVMTTRKLYPGKHKVELQINGLSLGTKSFELIK